MGLLLLNFVSNAFFVILVFSFFLYSKTIIIFFS
jgi:hypothetical protein